MSWKQEGRDSLTSVFTAQLFSSKFSGAQSWILSEQQACRGPATEVKNSSKADGEGGGSGVVVVAEGTTAGAGAGNGTGWAGVF